MAANDPDNQHIAARVAASGVTIGTQGVRAAADATDAWIDNNQASFNAALPEPFKSTATLEQKTLLFCYVAMKRAGIL